MSPFPHLKTEADPVFKTLWFLLISNSIDTVLLRTCELLRVSGEQKERKKKGKQRL
jgi:hypothetical protein